MLKNQEMDKKKYKLVQFEEICKFYKENQDMESFELFLGSCIEHIRGAISTHYFRVWREEEIALKLAILDKYFPNTSARLLNEEEMNKILKHYHYHNNHKEARAQERQKYSLVTLEERCKELTTGKVVYKKQSQFINAFKRNYANFSNIRLWGDEEKAQKLEIVAKYFPDRVNDILEFDRKEQERKIINAKKAEENKKILEAKKKLENNDERNF